MHYDSAKVFITPATFDVILDGATFQIPRPTFRKPADVRDGYT